MPSREKLRQKARKEKLREEAKAKKSSKEAAEEAAKAADQGMCHSRLQLASVFSRLRLLCRPGFAAALTRGE